MFTIKIYADGSTFLRSCESIHIISQVDIATGHPSTYDEECAKLKEDYLASSVLDGIEDREDGLSAQASKEHKLQEMMPYAFIKYDWNGNHCEWLLHGNDKAYVVSEQGKTIEAISAPSYIQSSIND